jgi:hypothetical protein
MKPEYREGANVRKEFERTMTDWPISTSTYSRGQMSQGGCGKLARTDRDVHANAYI